MNNKGALKLGSQSGPTLHVDKTLAGDGEGAAEVAESSFTLLGRRHLPTMASWLQAWDPAREGTISE